MKEIALSDGAKALVDDDDYEYLNRWKWVHSRGYAQRGTRVKGKGITIMMHRVVTKAPKGVWVDHINGSSLDNRKTNLRLCAPIRNSRNRKLSKRNLSGYRGVKQVGPSYRAIICIEGKNHHLGMFSTAEDAAQAYNAVARLVDSEFWKLNNI